MLKLTRIIIVISMLSIQPYAEAYHGHSNGYRNHYIGQPSSGYWRTGGWHHTWYGGRYGWWWLVGGAWYFYPAPIYPYPDYMSTTVVTETPPSSLMVAPPPVHTGGFTSTPYSFYCDNPPGYYPSVPACNGPWQEVPAPRTIRLQ